MWRLARGLPQVDRRPVSSRQNPDASMDNDGGFYREQASTPWLRALLSATRPAILPGMPPPCREAPEAIAGEAAEIARDRRLRMETGVILGLAKRLQRRLAYNDPLERRVKLSKLDAVFSVIGATRHLL